jgi:hypothetical protein
MSMMSAPAFASAMAMLCPIPRVPPLLTIQYHTTIFLHSADTLSDWIARNAYARDNGGLSFQREQRFQVAHIDV